MSDPQRTVLDTVEFTVHGKTYDDCLEKATSTSKQFMPDGWRGSFQMRLRPGGRVGSGEIVWWDADVELTVRREDT